MVIFVRRCHCFRSTDEPSGRDSFNMAARSGGGLCFRCRWNFIFLFPESKRMKPLTEPGGPANVLGAGSLDYKSNGTGGWLPSLTFSLGGRAPLRFTALTEFISNGK